MGSRPAILVWCHITRKTVDEKVQVVSTALLWVESPLAHELPCTRLDPADIKPVTGLELLT